MSAQQHVTAYTFCESLTATGSSPWHIRKLSPVGRYPGGGIDTASLCGRVRVRRGWDLQVPFSVPHPHACPECVTQYLARPKGETS